MALLIKIAKQLTGMQTSIKANHWKQTIEQNIETKKNRYKFKV